MNGRLEAMKRRVKEGAHKSRRTDAVPDVRAECEAEGLSWTMRAARLTRRMCEAESPVIEPDERIVFTRTIRKVPPLYSHSDWERITGGRTLHELGPVSNICADWGMALSEGLLRRRRTAQETRRRMKDDPEAVEFADAATEVIDAVLGLAERYAEKAREMRRDEIAEALERVPKHPPDTFYQALQFLRLCHAAVWLSGHYHVGLGRFDQYLWPYLEADIESGRIDVEEAEELLAEFFITLNKDSDLYPGVQQGDNGQSLMLGGLRRDGADGVNPLTRMTLRVARDVAMIDPKINLRISRDTDPELLALAVELTRIGLGFPQYSNDDVVIPALVAHGYDLEDARDYTVAACWEFIIPGKGMEVVNIGAVSLPSAADKGLRAGLAGDGSFSDILKNVAADIRDQVRDLTDRYDKLLLPPAPYYSVLMDGCLERGRDLSRGMKYSNFGIHGAASSNAADALACVKKLVYEAKSVGRLELLEALETNFEGDEPLREMLVRDGPKVGNNDDEADELLVWLFDTFADACESKSGDGSGRRIRPGSGSAMYYIWLATGHEGMREPTVGATADGRKAGDFFSANLAPSLGVKVRGPISVLQSFSKIDYRRICNGGPVTLELSDSLFHNREAQEKVAMLIRTFARIGCQQLQLNTMNYETLRDAQRHPERHKNLIVRVWGWSAYFCELDKVYQDHIIARHLYSAP